jgi:hypothetical protein
MNHFAYLAAGRHDVCVQALYAACSALAFRGGAAATVHVFTDTPEFFNPIAGAIELIEITPEIMREWRGPSDFVLRAKLCVSLKMMEMYPQDPTFLIDADTFFYREYAELLSRVGPQDAVLHRKEYHVATHPTGQLIKFRRHVGRVKFRGKPLDLSIDMWNSGVTGVHPAQRERLEEAIEIIDLIAPHYRKPFIDQYAVSLCLKDLHLHSADEFIFHYWNQKAEYMPEMERRLDRWRTMPLEDSLAEMRAKRIELPVTGAGQSG